MIGIFVNKIYLLWAIGNLWELIMRDVLEYFLDTELNFRTADKDKGIISTVDRIPQGKGLPPLFSKKIAASHWSSYLISYEIGFLEKTLRFAPEARVVRLRKTNNEYMANSQVIYKILTESAGIDSDKWSLLPVQLQHNGRHYKNIFSHPAVLLRFVRGSLIALKSIHKHGIVHCDFKGDQLCIPFSIQQSKDKRTYTITPNFDQITIIDFGTALWELCPIDHATNPSPFKVPSNWQQGRLDGQEYRGGGLVKASAEQIEHYKTHKKYNFAKACQDVDCAMDLYSFGYLLKCMLAENLEDSIEQHPSEADLWGVFFDEYQKWTDELIKYEYGFFGSYTKDNLPHDDYIAKINEWLRRVDERQGYPSDQLVFVVNNARIIKNIKEKESKLVSGNVALQSKAGSKAKLIGVIFGLGILLLLVLWVLPPSEIDKENLGTEGTPSITTEPSTDTTAQAEPPKEEAMSAEIPLPTPLNSRYSLTARTVHDTKTDITWRYCPVGQVWEAGRCMGQAAHLTYQEAKQQIDMLNAQSITLGIQGKWRLPTLKELDTLKLCDKKMTTISINNQSTEVAYACNQGSLNAFDTVAFPNIDTAIWSSDVVSKNDLALFDNQDKGYWVVNLSKGSIAKKTADEQSIALLVLDKIQ